MLLKTIEITGYRGFETQATIHFALPNGKQGSGLTVITGANNTGKTAILECIRARAGYTHFHTGYRNVRTDETFLRYIFENATEEIRSVKKGDSRIEHRYSPNRQPNILVIPARRPFVGTVGGPGSVSREDYIGSSGLRPQRSGSFDFPPRLHVINSAPENFNSLLTKILGFEASWTIDSGHDGSYFIKYRKGNFAHTGEGLGDGILNAFVLADALYDSKQNEMVCFDEPELSLHPSAQRRLMEILMYFSSDRQIVVATHSPYFIDAGAIMNGGSVVRTTGVSGSSLAFQIADPTRRALAKLTGKSATSALGNVNSPHTFGLDAKEIFFQEDGILLCEGSDDVQLIPHAARQLKTPLMGSWYGWGAGGAGNIPSLCTILKELGFERVAALIDADKAAEIPRMGQQFPGYLFVVLPAKDIRTKAARPATAEVIGLLDETFQVRTEYRDTAANTFKKANAYLIANPVPRS